MTESLAKQLYEAKKKWAEKDRLASVLELGRKPTLGTVIEVLKNDDVKTAISLIEWKAYASAEYKEYIKKMTKARMEAHILFAKVESIREEIEEIKRQNMNENMQMKYTSGYGGKI